MGIPMVRSINKTFKVANIIEIKIIGKIKQHINKVSINKIKNSIIFSPI